MSRRPRRAGTHFRGAGLAGWRRMPRARKRRGSRHLFDRWAEVHARLKAAKHIPLFLDFDGTLTPIRRRPGEVRLGVHVRRTIAHLARSPRFMIYLISGRRLKDLRRRAPIPGVGYLGLHGWERERGGKELSVEPLQAAQKVVVRSLGPLDGIWVEDKGLSFVVHYRGASKSATQSARTRLRQALKPFADRLRVLSGKKVWEILPNEVAGKGEAVRDILRELRRPALPVYIGDDTTDEAAFKVLPRGITARVGPARRTRASFRLRGPEEVWSFLEKMESELL